MSVRHIRFALQWLKTSVLAAMLTMSADAATLDQTIQFSPLSGVVYGAQPLPLTAMASSGLAVQFASTTPSVCSVASSKVTILAAGNCTVVATQPGDGTYSAAPSVSMSFAVAKRSQTLPTADMVFGQAGRLDNGLINYTGGDSFQQPGGVVADGAGGLYVADTWNYRVLHYPPGSLTADRVYGQPAFNTQSSAFAGAASLISPFGIALDGGGGLYVADTGCSRVLHYPSGSTAADRVYGQPLLAGCSRNSGGIGATSLASPFGVAVDPAGGVYVADADNNRVLHYPSGSTIADRVYGQPNFTSNSSNNGGITGSSLSYPTAVGVDAAGGVYVADRNNNRVLHYLSGATIPDRVYGQPDFVSNAMYNGGISAGSLRWPSGVVVDAAGGVYVADGDSSRVLHYPIGSTTADRVYGQPDFTSVAENNGGISASSLGYPTGVALDSGGGLYVADYNNNRVLHYPPGATVADRVYGKLTFTQRAVGANTVNGPAGVTQDTLGGIYVSDSGSLRVLHYSVGSVTADGVYGQPEFASFNGWTAADRLLFGRHVAADGSGGIYIADSYSNRVVHYPSGGLSADRVYGQSDFTSSNPNNGGISASSLNFPIGVAVDGAGGFILRTPLTIGCCTTPREAPLQTVFMGNPVSPQIPPTMEGSVQAA